MRALIVDDEFVSRKVLSAFLKTSFETDIAVNGKEAVTAFTIAHAEGHPYDLILMDIMMPEMDGMEALAIIRTMEHEKKYRPQVKVLMTTALDDAKTVIRSFHDGEAAGFIVKPVLKDNLFTELKKLGFVTE